jgi:hypothetical protein
VEKKKIVRDVLTGTTEFIGLSLVSFILSCLREKNYFNIKL